MNRLKKIFAGFALAVLLCQNSFAFSAQNELRGAEQKITVFKQQKNTKITPPPAAAKAAPAKQYLSPEEKERIAEMTRRIDAYAPLSYHSGMASYSIAESQKIIEAAIESYFKAVFGYYKKELTQFGALDADNAKNFKELLSKNPEIKYMGSGFKFTDLLEDDTQFLFFNEIHVDRPVSYFNYTILELQEQHRLAGIATEFLVSHHEAGIKKFKQTGDVESVRIFTDGSTTKDRINWEWLFLAKDENIIPLEQSEDDFLGIALDEQPVYTGNNFIVLLTKYAEKYSLPVALDNSGDHILFRNIKWVRILEKAVENKQVVLVHLGAAHGAYNSAFAPSVTDMLADKGFKIVNIYFFSAKYHPGAKDIKNASKSFIVKVPPDFQDKMPYDYVVYMPD
ncbi:hypothetical protein Dip510_000376 [Elusimicrobium posterum]|uniref:hypothetical protein n=1 Tax=Elusimicrobium posterum TaxID=3116653 RepID=UPI003C77F40E